MLKGTFSPYIYLQQFVCTILCAAFVISVNRSKAFFNTLKLIKLHLYIWTWSLLLLVYSHTQTNE